MYAISTFHNFLASDNFAQTPQFTTKTTYEFEHAHDPGIGPHSRQNECERLRAQTSSLNHTNVYECIRMCVRYLHFSTILPKTRRRNRRDKTRAFSRALAILTTRMNPLLVCRVQNLPILAIPAQFPAQFPPISTNLPKFTKLTQRDAQKRTIERPETRNRAIRTTPSHS